MATHSRRTLLKLAGATALSAVGLRAVPTARAVLAQAPPVPEIPATRVGKQLRWLLGQINAGAADLTTADLRRRFSADFLAALPAEDLLGLFRTYFAPSGPMQVARFEGGVTDRRANAILTTPGADWRIRFAVDPADKHRIVDLFLDAVALPAPPEKPPRALSDLDRSLKKLAPRRSFVAAELTETGIRPIHALDPDHALGIGSTFKLYVLGELARQVAAGQATWPEPLAIRDELRSLPNGDMRLEGAGAAFPLRHFAEQMIAASDNTATDHLIARLGRENVEAVFPAMGHADPGRNAPLLLTREWFAFKLRVPPKEVAAYLAADLPAKRAFLAERVDPLAATLTDVDDWVGAYLTEEIEWFASAADLTRALASLHATATRAEMPEIHDALSLESGIAFDARTWAYVGYKGGYESGVNSDAWLLQRADGRWFTLSVVTNNPQQEINGYALWQLMTAAAALLAKAK